MSPVQHTYLRPTTCRQPPTPTCPPKRLSDTLVLGGKFCGGQVGVRDKWALGTSLTSGQGGYECVKDM